MKYTLDWCLFRYQQNNATTQSRQCGETCAGPQGAMRIAMTDRVLQTNATIQYQYCEGEDGAFEKNVDECVSCLEDVPSSMALANCTSQGDYPLRQPFAQAMAGVKLTFIQISAP